jgi:ribonuclease D
VSDLSSLVACSRDLNSSPLIAVDLEHHSQRSFLGIVCLMQLSTVTCDYIIDTLVRIALMIRIFENGSDGCGMLTVLIALVECCCMYIIDFLW